MKSQRVAGGGIAIWRELLNGLLRANLNRDDSKYGLTASTTVICVAYMLVYEKWTICQFEWHRGFYSSQACIYAGLRLFCFTGN